MRDSVRAAATYDFLMSALDWMLIRKWRRLLWDQVKGPQVLEVGVGTGLNISHYPEEIRVTASDVSEHFLKRARRRALDSEVLVEVVHCSIEALPFDDSSFDSVVATFLFCSVANPLVGLSEILRVLKGGGTLMLLEHVGSEGPLGRVMEWVAEPLYRITGDHVARNTEATVREAGFGQVSSQPLLMNAVRLIRGEKDSS